MYSGVSGAPSDLLALVFEGDIDVVVVRLVVHVGPVGETLPKSLATPAS